MSFTKGQLFEEFFSQKYKDFTRNESLAKGIEFIQSKISNELNEIGRQVVEGKLKFQMKLFLQTYSKHSDMVAVKRKYKDEWDDLCITICDEWLVHPENQPSTSTASSSSASSSSAQRGRPPKDLKELGQRQIYRKAIEFAERADFNEEILLHALKHAAKQNENSELLRLISPIVSAFDHNTLQNKTVVNRADNEPLKKLTGEEALWEVLYNNLSKNQYQHIKNLLDEMGFHILPSYHDVADAKKMCRPPPKEATFTDTKASVSLKAVTKHTVDRTFELKANDIEQLVEKSNQDIIETEFIFARGGDGSTGQSQYQQRASDGSMPKDSALFTITMTPLVWRTTCGKKIELWKNPIPRSADGNRPILLEFTKETPEYVVEQFKLLREQEEEMAKDPFVKAVGNKAIKVHCKFFDTLVDMKVANVLAKQKGSQRCFICSKTPREFNMLLEFLPTDDELCQYGFSQTHFIINCFKFLLKLASKDIHGVRFYKSNASVKAKIEARLKEILAALEAEFHIKFEQVKADGFGSTTTGNVCRKAFAKPEVLAEILRLDVELVTNFATIISLLHSLEDIDIDKFEELCTATHRFFGPGGKYHWYYLSPTVHKVLAHSRQIMAILPLSPGYFSEEGAEAHNKYYKTYRLRFAQKSSREANLRDVINRAMDKSDPKLFAKAANKRLKRKAYRPLPPRAQYYIKQSNDDEEANDDEYSTAPPTFTDNIDDSLDDCIFDVLEDDDDEYVEDDMSTDSE